MMKSQLYKFHNLTLNTNISSPFFTLTSRCSNNVVMFSKTSFGKWILSNLVLSTYWSACAVVATFDFAVCDSCCVCRCWILVITRAVAAVCCVLDPPWPRPRPWPPWPPEFDHLDHPNFLLDLDLDHHHHHHSNFHLGCCWFGPCCYDEVDLWKIGLAQEYSLTFPPQLEFFGYCIDR